MSDPSPLALKGWDAVDPFAAEQHNWWIRLEHLGRYLFAADYLRGREAAAVLDAASGTGFGAAELGRSGYEVLGLDNDPEMLAYASRCHSSASVTYREADLEAGDLELPDQPPFDALVSFETLEHLVDPAGALRRLVARLRDGATVICSMPIRASEGRTTAGLPANALHKQLFSLEGGQRLLEGEGLEVEYRLGQSLVPRLMKRERKISAKGKPESRPSAIPALEDPEALRAWARLVATPTAEDVEESYSATFVARVRADRGAGSG